LKAQKCKIDSGGLQCVQHIADNNNYGSGGCNMGDDCGGDGGGCDCGEGDGDNGHGGDGVVVTVVLEVMVIMVMVTVVVVVMISARNEHAVQYTN
jgi:hypothetical protein